MESTSKPTKSAKSTKQEEQIEDNGNVTAKERKALPAVFTVPPPQVPGKKKPGQLTAKQVKQYFEEVRDFSI